MNLLAALRYASLMHRDQRRKDSVKSPYVNHLIDVANLLSSVGRVNDECSLMAAVLHDVVEDTKATHEELEVKFGRSVRELVEELTDDQSLSYLEQREAVVNLMAKKSKEAQTIKLADFISNVRDLPFSWSKKRKSKYLDFITRAAKQIAEPNEKLMRVLQSELNSALKNLQ